MLRHAAVEASGEAMNKLVLLVIALVLVSIPAAQAQLWVDPGVWRDGTEIQRGYRSSLYRNLHNDYSYPGSIHPSTGKRKSDDLNRDLQQHENQNRGWPNERNPYQINPYQFRW